MRKSTFFYLFFYFDYIFFCVCICVFCIHTPRSGWLASCRWCHGYQPSRQQHNQHQKNGVLNSVAIVFLLIYWFAYFIRNAYIFKEIQFCSVHFSPNEAVFHFYAIAAVNVSFNFIWLNIFRSVFFAHHFIWFNTHTNIWIHMSVLILVARHVLHEIIGQFLYYYIM